MKERYEQEIEQLLNELEAESPSPANAPQPTNGSARPLDDQPSPFTPKPKPSVRLISPNKLALAGLILALLGLLPLLPVQVSLVGLAIIIAAVAWMVIQRMGSQQQPAYWRGRPMDEPPQGTWQRFRQWLSK